MKKNKQSGFILILMVCMLFCVSGLLQHVKANMRSGRVFGLSCMTMNNEFYEVIQSELLKTIQQNDDILITMDPQLDLERQIEQLNSLIDQDVDGIFLNPIDSDALNEPLQRAAALGIPVVIIDAPVSEDNPSISTIVSDNYMAGVLCAKDMMSRMESAHIGLLKHTEVQSAHERIQGFLDTIEGHENYQVVAQEECKGQLELAMPAVEKMLDEHPEIDVIMALNDPSALGALATLQSRKIDSIGIYGVDGTPDVKKHLLDQSNLIATAAQSPIQIGKIAAAAMYDYLDNQPIERFVELPVWLITKDNVSSSDAARWQ